MKINKWLYVSAALLMLAGCNDEWNEDKLDGFKYPETTDIKQLEYTLTAADYKTIASNSTNKALAEADGVADELSKLTNNKYFTDNISASKYVPAFLAATYPTADDKSSIKVTYNKLVGEPAYLSAIGSSKYYQLSDEDYQTVWGQVVKASYLSPKTENRIPKLLLEAMPGAAEGDMVMVDYAYSDVEPSIGGGGSETAEPTWTQLNVPIRSTGANWNFVNTGVIDLSEYKGMTVNIGFKYTSTTSSCPKWEFKNFKALAVPYLDVLCFSKQEDGTFKKVTKVEGAGEYVFAAVGADGSYYPYTKLADDKTYGFLYPKAVVVADGVIAAADAANHVMTLEATDGGYYLKDANGRYIYSTNYDSFSVSTSVEGDGYVWTVASAGGADLFCITNVTTQKSIKLNYYNGSYSYGCYAASKVENNQYFANSLCGDEGGFTTYDVNAGGLEYVWRNDATYGWVASAQVSGVNHETESYVVSPAIEIGENAALPYVTVDEAFKFGTADQITVWVSTDYAALTTRSLAAARAAYGCNRTALYAFDGTAWSKHTLSDVTLDVMQPADYSSLSVGYLASPTTVLPIYLKNKYPYAQEDDMIAVAYYATAENAVGAKELTYNGTEWVMTEEAVAATDQFVKSNGAWIYDPSVVIELPAGKNQPLSTLYYQAATDWVWEHIDQPNGITTKGQGYVTSYGNNEYYTGASAYQGNADWRANQAKSQYPAGYEGLSDAEIVALMQQHFIEVMGEVLGELNPEAKLVDGVDVYYTINFGVYTGSSENWTIQYKLVDNAKFEYVEDSLKKRD